MKIKPQGISITERVAHAVLAAMLKNKSLDRMDYLKCKLGLEVFFINISKLIIIYGLAILMKIFIPVLILHISFMCIRTNGYGGHSVSSIKCTIISCIILVGIPLALMNYILIPRWILFMMGVSNFFIINKYAPVGSKKNPIVNENKREQLRIKTISMGVILLLLSMACPYLKISNLIIAGSTSACMLLLPITNKILNKEK